MNLFTIGFTQKTAQQFFETLRDNGIGLVIDVRLNNTSQLAGFSKYPDIRYFLEKLCGCRYVHDTGLTPTEKIMKDFKEKRIDPKGFVSAFEGLMAERGAEEQIRKDYADCRDVNVCLLCSEEKPDFCHRSIVARLFQKVYGGEIVHL